MPHLAFCSNCGSDRLQIGATTAAGIEVTCYTCTKKTRLDGIVLGEVDFLAGAKSRVDAMLARAKEKALATRRRAAAPR